MIRKRSSVLKKAAHKKARQEAKKIDTAMNTKIYHKVYEYAWRLY